MEIQSQAITILSKVVEGIAVNNTLLDIGLVDPIQEGVWGSMTRGHANEATCEGDGVDSQ